MKLPTISTRPARGMRRRESSIACEAAGASAAGYDFRRAKNYLEMAEECAELSAAGPLVEMEKQVIRCQEAQVALAGRAAGRGGGRRIGVLEGTPRRSGPAGPGGRPVVLRRGAPQPRAAMV